MCEGALFVDRFVQTAMDAYGRIDAVVNNAGYGQVGPLELLRAEELRAQFETNVVGLQLVTNAFLPLLRRVPAVGDRIVFAGWRFEVLGMDGRRVDRVRASRDPGETRESST